MLVSLFIALSHRLSSIRVDPSLSSVRLDTVQQLLTRLVLLSSGADNTFESVRGTKAYRVEQQAS
jgi:hypothetical protein